MYFDHEIINTLYLYGCVQVNTNVHTIHALECINISQDKPHDRTYK